MRGTQQQQYYIIYTVSLHRQLPVYFRHSTQSPRHNKISANP